MALSKFEKYQIEYDAFFTESLKVLYIIVIDILKLPGLALVYLTLVKVNKYMDQNLFFIWDENKLFSHSCINENANLWVKI